MCYTDLEAGGAPPEPDILFPNPVGKRSLRDLSARILEQILVSGTTAGTEISKKSPIPAFP